MKGFEGRDLAPNSRSVDPEAAALALLESHRTEEGAAAEHLRLGREARRRGEMREAEKHFRAGISGAGTNLALAATSTFFLGRLLERVGNFSAAADTFRRSAEFSTKAGLTDWARMSRNILARVLLRLGDIAAAEAILEETGREAARVGDRLGQAITARLAGEARIRRGDLAAAEGLLEKARGLFEALGETRYLSPLLFSLGDVRERLDRIPEALATFEAALGIAQRGSKVLGIRQAGTAVARLGVRLAAEQGGAGAPQEASRYLDRAAAGAEAAGNNAAVSLVAEHRRRLAAAVPVAGRPSTAYVEEVRAADAAFMTGDFWTAVDRFQRAIEALPGDATVEERRSLRWRLGEALHRLGHWYDYRYDLESAAECWRRRIEIAVEVGDADGLRHSRRRLDEIEVARSGGAFTTEVFPLYEAARRARAVDDLETAIALFRQALAAERNPEGRRLLSGYLGFGLMERAEVLLARGDVETARAIYRESLEVFQTVGNDRGRELVERALMNLPAEIPTLDATPPDALEEARQEVLDAEAAADLTRLRTAIERFVDSLFRRTSAAIGRGDLQEARETLTAGRHLVGRLGTPEERRAMARAAAEVEIDLSEATVRAGRPEEAAQMLREACNLAEAAGDAPLIERAQRALGVLGPRLKPQIRVVRAAKIPPGGARALMALSEQARITKDFARAVELLEQALEITRAGRDPKDYARAAASLEFSLYGLGKERLEAGNIEGAIEAYRRRLAVLLLPPHPMSGETHAPMGNHVSLHFARVLLGNLLVRTAQDQIRNKAAATAILLEALELFDTARDLKGRGRAGLLLERIGVTPPPRPREIFLPGWAIGTALVLVPALVVLVTVVVALNNHEPLAGRRRSTGRPVRNAEVQETPTVRFPRPPLPEILIRVTHADEAKRNWSYGYPARRYYEIPNWESIPPDVAWEWRVDGRYIEPVGRIRKGGEVAIDLCSPGEHKIECWFLVPGAENRCVFTDEVELCDRLNINAASVEQIDGLQGVGEETARRIVAEREAGGAFSNVEDLHERTKMRRTAGYRMLSDSSRCSFGPLVLQCECP